MEEKIKYIKYNVNNLKSLLNMSQSLSAEERLYLQKLLYIGRYILGNGITDITVIDKFLETYTKFKTGISYFKPLNEEKRRLEKDYKVSIDELEIHMVNDCNMPLFSLLKENALVENTNLHKDNENLEFIKEKLENNFTELHFFGDKLIFVRKNFIGDEVFDQISDIYKEMYRTVSEFIKQFDSLKIGEEYLYRLEAINNLIEGGNRLFNQALYSNNSESLSRVLDLLKQTNFLLSVDTFVLYNIVSDNSVSFK